MIYIKQENEHTWAVWQGEPGSKPRRMDVRYRTGQAAIERAAKLSDETGQEIKMVRENAQVERCANSAYAPTPCSARFEPANGETVTPCHLPSGHDGNHEGRCLGSACAWPQGVTCERELIEPNVSNDVSEGSEAE